MRDRMRESNDRPSARPISAWMYVPIALLAIALQTTLAPRIEIRTVRPDWLLLLAVYLALHAPRRQAVVVAWTLGFLAELLTLERMGWISASYALAGWSLATLRDALTAESIVTEIVAAVVIGFVVFGAWSTIRALVDGAAAGGVLQGWAEALARAVYTALSMVPLHLLHRTTALMLAFFRTPRHARK